MSSALRSPLGCQAAVFLLAENRLMREALLRVLSKKDDISIVGAAPYSPFVLQEVCAVRSNVVVLDSLSNALSGAQVLAQLRAADPVIKVVMVAMDADEAIFLKLVQAGVLGYVLKDASAAEVARAIRAVAAGEAVCPPVLSAALFRWVAHTLAVRACKPGPSLSLREQQLLRLIRDGLSNKEVAARLNLSQQTVRNHVHRMLRKVGAPDRVTMVELCRTEIGA